MRNFSDFFTAEGMELLESGQTLHFVPPEGEDQEEHENSTLCWCETKIHMLANGTIICEHFDQGERLARYEEQNRDLSAA